MGARLRTCLTVAVAGAAGALAAGDAAGAVAWLSVAALPGGLACARAGAVAVLVPVVWLGAASAAGLASGLPGLSAAVLGVFATGVGGGRLARAEPARGAALALVAALVLAALPTRAGLGGRPWAPGAARLLLDVSPPAVFAECAGLDWMRREPVYVGAGTDRFWRAPWRGERAGAALLALGVLVLVASRRRAACL